jgi:hypothetical protein
VKDARLGDTCAARYPGAGAVPHVHVQIFSRASPEIGGDGAISHYTGGPE